MSTPKEKEIIRNLIELYKDMPYLWCKSDKNYFNKTARNEGFIVLLSVYKTLDENATMKTLKKKIDNLKTNYFKEHKKVKASKHTGAGNEDVYVPSIWYYDNFSFLESSTESCRSITETEEDENSSLSCIEDFQNETANSSINTYSSSKENIYKKKKKETPLKRQQDILEQAAGLINAKEEDWEILGRSIGLQLRDLSLQQLAVARKLISDVIFFGTLNKLSEYSFVDVSKSPSNTNIQSSPPRPAPSTPYNIPTVNSPVHTLKIPNKIQSSPPRPAPSTPYNIPTLNSPVHTLKIPNKIQSSPPRPAPSTPYNIPTLNSPVHTLKIPNKIQSSSVRPAPNILTLNSPIHTSIRIPHKKSSSPHPVPRTSYHSQSSESDKTVVFEGSGDLMKDFLIFKN